MDLGLQDSLAVVAGGTSGIGLAVPLALAAEGCRVLAISRGSATAALGVLGVHTITADLTAAGAD